jgi:ribosome-binding protein aMBF1 (putative translation factor)
MFLFWTNITDLDISVYIFNFFDTDLSDMEKGIFNKAFGEYVRMKRKECKMSQAKLSYKMGLDYQYISRVERGHISPTLLWITRLSKALDISLDQFVAEFSTYATKSSGTKERL